MLLLRVGGIAGRASDGIHWHVDPAHSDPLPLRREPRIDPRGRADRAATARSSATTRTATRRRRKPPVATLADDGLRRLPQPAEPHLPAARARSRSGDGGRPHRQGPALRPPRGAAADPGRLRRQGGRRRGDPCRPGRLLPGAVSRTSPPPAPTRSRTAADASIESWRSNVFPADEGRLEHLSRTTSATRSRPAASAATTTRTRAPRAAPSRRTAIPVTRCSRRKRRNPRSWRLWRPEEDHARRRPRLHPHVGRSSSRVLALALLAAALASAPPERRPPRTVSAATPTTLSPRCADGREVSAFVDGERYAASRHGDLACVDCHADLVDLGDGHGDDVAPVDCASCHDAAPPQIAAGVHGGARRARRLRELPCSRTP